MTEDHWQRVKALFQVTVDRPASERAAFLAAAVDGDEAMRRDVESLLSADSRTEHFTGALPIAAVARAADSAGSLPSSSAPPSPAVLTTGLVVGSYAIVAPLGAGGMGEVYRARDARLNRDVALKVLQPRFALDPSHLARFQREAQALAALNHPNIAAIYGLEESQGHQALVLELVEGPTLADRIARGPLPLHEVLVIARQIADALEAAHEKGIVHRDLKPANIKITSDGVVKVLDFGLAKAASGDTDANRSQAPTITVGDTREGVLLGTAAYMSPEQARAQAVDKRADIWAFGCVLYEMVSGRMAFAGETVSDTLSAILTSEPDYRLLPDTTPASTRRLLRRCLEKDQKRRLHDIADARIDIDDAISGADNELTNIPARADPQKRHWRTVGFASLVVSAAVIAILLWRSNTPAVRPDAPEMRLHIVTPSTANPSFLALSPDGRTIVFEATKEGRRQLWLRSFDSDDPQPLAGTENPAYPFWSPDSRSIGFFADGQLKRIDPTTGTVLALADAPAARGGSWTFDGTILFGSLGAPIRRVLATGGAATDATLPTNLQQRFPVFFPDGRHFLVFCGTAGNAREQRGLYVGSLESKEIRRLMDADSSGVFAAPDLVLFARQGNLLAQRLDLQTVQVVGDPVPVARSVSVGGPVTNFLAASASLRGDIAYRSGADERQLVWMNRSGQEIDTLSAPDAADLRDIRISSDSRAAAIVRRVNGNQDVWVLEPSRGLRRVTIDPADEEWPVWSRDGTRLAFASNRRGSFDLYEKPALGGSETLLLQTSEQKLSQDWSPDGRFILYQGQNAKTGADLGVLPLFGDREPRAIAQTTSDERNGRFSPDGNWVAYQSNETGPYEVYIQPFPMSGEKYQASNGGGTSPQWRPDGKLLYIGADNRLFEVPLTPKGTRMQAGTPTPLFRLPPFSEYAISPDGQRFLVNKITEVSPITVIVNWPSLLTSRTTGQ